MSSPGSSLLHNSAGNRRQRSDRNDKYVENDERRHFVQIEKNEDYSGEECGGGDEDETKSLGELQWEEKDIIQQITSICEHRIHLREDVIEPLQTKYRDEWSSRLSQAERDFSEAQSSLMAVHAHCARAEEDCSFANSWHVLGDAFFVWHRGPFGTINGIRLGRSAETTAAKVAAANRGGGIKGKGALAASVVERSQQKLGTGTLDQFASSFFFWESSHAIAAAKGDESPKPVPTPSSKAVPATASGGVPTEHKITVPWTEINAALGQVVLLLHIIESDPHSGISFRKHVLKACGSTSKVGVVKSSSRYSAERRKITALSLTSEDSREQHPSHPLPSPSPPEVTWYNLHHYEESGSMLSMGYFARRNFNTALAGLVHCLADASRAAAKRDPTMAAPHTIDVGGGGGGGGETTIGGIPVAYDPAAGERWTKVCKYLLTDLKWLVSYGAKHVHR